MPITYYDTVNGQLIGQTTGGVRTEYLTDALGSVTATVNSSGEIVNTYRYKPYGQLLAKTGSGEDPRYLWTGNTGSRRTQVTYAEQYNQARHYGAKQAGWTTVDPLWPDEFAYGYIEGNPTSRLDPLGDQGIPLPVAPPVRFLPPSTNPGVLPAPRPIIPAPAPSAGTRCISFLWGDDSIFDVASSVGNDIAKVLFPLPAGQNPGDRDPKCDDDLLARLTLRVDRKCHIPGVKYSCSGLKWPKDAKKIQEAIDRIRDCIKARRIREATCWNGGDEGHREALNNLQVSLKNCLIKVKRWGV